MLIRNREIIFYIPRKSTINSWAEIGYIAKLENELYEIVLINEHSLIRKRIRIRESELEETIGREGALPLPNRETIKVSIGMGLAVNSKGQMYVTEIRRLGEDPFRKYIGEAEGRFSKRADKSSSIESDSRLVHS